MFEIKKNVPVPAERNNWPFKDMEINDCMSVPKEWWSKAQRTAHITGRQKGMEFKTQWDKAENIGKIWRIK